MSAYGLPPGLALPEGAGPPDLGGGMPPGLPPELAGALQQGGQPPPPPADPLQSLQDAIHSVTSAMASLPGAQDTQDAAQALLVLSRIQTRLMSQSAAPQG